MIIKNLEENKIHIAICLNKQVFDEWKSRFGIINRYNPLIFTGERDLIGRRPEDIIFHLLEGSSEIISKISWDNPYYHFVNNGSEERFDDIGIKREEMRGKNAY